MSARVVALRGIWTGAAYGAAYFLTETLGAAGVFAWLGAGVGIFRMIEREMATLLAQYVLFGAVVGLLLAPAVAAIEPRLSARWRGPGINVQLLGWAFIATAFLWNPDSILPRRFYVLAAFGAQAIILLFMVLARLGRAAARRVPSSGRAPVLAAAAMTALALLVWLGLPRSAPRPAARGSAAALAPNVVLIVVDTLRRDHLSAYGYGRKTSPSVDRLAAEGALFERAYSTASWTLPAHASLFTGLYPSAHRTDTGSIRLPTSVLTLAQILAARGYRAAGFSANPWVTALNGFDRGFERFDYVGVRTVTGVFFLNLAREGWRARRGLAPTDLGGEDVTDSLLRWMAGAHAAGGPFFAFANYMEVHEPYGSVPEPFFSAFVAGPVPPTAGRRWVREAPLFLCSGCAEGGSEADGLQCTGGRWRVGAERVSAATALYDAGVLYVDHQIGRVIEALERARALDDTLVVVTSDHGETLGERGQMGHGGLLYNSVLDIPLVIRYPRLFPPGTRVAEPASLVDLLPTVAGAAGAPLPALADARSLASPAARAERPVLAEYFPVAEHVWRAVGRKLRCDYQLAGRESASIEKEGFKYIWSSRGDHELYEPAADPHEERNLIHDRPDVGSRLDAELRAWRARLRASRPAAEDKAMDPATRKVLESLGYVN